MTITALMKQKEQISNDIVAKVNENTIELIKLADAMAEAATNVHGHGYQQFITARENFIETIWSMNRDYSQIGKFLS